MLSDYPEVLSGEQVRLILHISKRKCAWMLNNGFIKCQNSGKKTRKYVVLAADLEEYIKDSKQHPEKYVTPSGAFNAKGSETLYSRKSGFPTALPLGFREWLKVEFEPIQDMLEVKHIASITGYNDDSVKRWIKKGWLESASIA